MKKISQFCRDHPVMIACITTAILSAAVMELFWIDIIQSTFGEKADGPLVAFHLFVLLAIPALWWAAFEATKPVAIILATALFFGVPKTNAAPVIVIGGLLVVVIAGGAIVGCKIVKRCNKIAKKRENGLTNEQFMVAAGDNYAALLTWTEDSYCAEERLLPTTPTVFTMCPLYIAPGETRVLTRADRGNQFVEDWNGFQQEVSSHDLFLSKPVSYSKNGHRCEPEQSIISFTPSRTAKIGKGGLFYVVERSNDLKTWERVLWLEVEPWMSPRIEECSDDDKQFYRIGAATL